MPTEPVRGRDAELAVLREVVGDVLAGRGAALTLRGPSGSGRTTLLDALCDLDPDVVVRRTTGVESERDLPFGAVHRLLDPLRPNSSASVHDVARAAAERHPVLVVVDDAQWLDAESRDALAFLAHRCAGHHLGVVVATAFGFDDLPQLPLAPLSQLACDRLLADRGDLSAPVRSSVAELSGGNPGQLVDIAAALTPAQMAGWEPLPQVLPADGRQGRELRRSLRAASGTVRDLALMVACEGRMDRVVADRAGFARCVADSGARAGLLVADGSELRCPTPAVRATLYAQASAAERRRAHSALAAALDGDDHASARLWHEVAAGARPESGQALAAAARRDRVAGRHDCAASAWERAAHLAGDAPSKAARLVEAASSSWTAGRPGAARDLLVEARSLADSAELVLVLGEIELRDGEPAVAARQLALAAEGLSGEQRGAALMLAAEAHRMAGDVTDYVRLARLAAGPGVPPLVAAYFEGLVAVSAGDHRVATTALRRALDLGVDARGCRELMWLAEIALLLGEADLSYEHATAAVGQARLAGEVTVLPAALALSTAAALILDRHRAAVATGTQGVVAAQAVGQRNSVAENVVMLAVAAVAAGDCEAALERVEQAMPVVGQRSLGKQAAWAAWTRACVDLLEDRPEDALGRLRTMATGVGRAHPAMRVIIGPQLVEAAVRCGRRDEAAQVLALFERWARWSSNATWLALVHRCHGLLAEDSEDAAGHYRTAIMLHGQAGSTIELGRTQLHYAQRLRRERQAVAAREHLRDALRLFQLEDASYWADRVRVELRAAGDPDVADAAAADVVLSPQQQQIARLVAEGQTNREIARAMTISQRTVDHHLRNIFQRLGVRSRVEVATAFLRTNPDA